MSKNKVKTSLLIITYNWPEALELVLLSVKNQSVLPNEIIIADDGSTDATRILIEKYKQIFSIPLIQVWHEDIGYRKSTIMNKALKMTNGDYIIQIDGDIIIHKRFIENHINLAKPNTFIHGSRTFLNLLETQKAFLSKKIEYSIFNRNLKSKINGIYFPFLTRFFDVKNINLNKTRGCNFSCWREDIFKVNGYNEDMTGWGLEDTELDVRLMNNGILKRQIKFSAIEYHLEHKTNSRDKLNLNKQILDDTIKKNLKITNNGILKLNL